MTAIAGSASTGVVIHPFVLRVVVDGLSGTLAITFLPTLYDKASEVFTNSLAVKVECLSVMP